MNKEYIKKLEDEIKWLTSRERYQRNNLELLIEMVEDIAEDTTLLEDKAFVEIVNAMKNRDLREPWQVKISHPSIKKGTVRVHFKPENAHDSEEE